MSEPGAFEAVVAEVGKLLLPLQRSLDSPGAFRRLLLELGWRADDVPQPLKDLGADLEVLFERVSRLTGGGLSFDGSVTAGADGAAVDVDPEDVVRTLEAIKDVVEGIERIAAAPDAAFPASLIADGFKSAFPKQLVGYLFNRYLEVHRPGIGFALQALGVTKIRYRPAAGNRPDHVEHRLDFPDLPKLFDDPGVLLENAFGWGTPDFDYRWLESKVDDLMTSLDRRVTTDDVPLATAKLLEGGAPVPDRRRRRRTRVVFFERGLDSGRLAAEVSLFPLPESGAEKPGLAVMPSFNGPLSVRFELGPNVALTLSSDLDVEGGVALLFRPGRGIEMVLGFDSPGAPVHAKGSGRVEVEFSRSGGTPFPLLGTSGGTRLEVVSARGACGFQLDAAGEVEVFAEIETEGLAFVLDPSASDGFISKLLAGVSTRFEFDLALGLGYPRGFYFRGTSNLEIQVPAHLDLGPIEVQGLTLAVRPSGHGLPIDLGATFKAQLGPLAAVVEDIGLRTDLSFPDQGGNLGPVDLGFRFKAPTGVGLSIDAGAVKGGGYLSIDPDRGEYAGALELRILDFLTVSAIGVITTKLPDGSKGFAFIAIISVEFNPGLQLGFGFTLLGVGGLIGLNRSMDLDALVRGARSGALDSILFPRDVVANAPRIISDLRTFFPPEQGTFLIGPMSKLGWGTPTLISLSLGILIEIPGNIAIVGKLTVAIPDPRAALIVIQVAFMGAIELDRKRGWFFATLYESRVIYMPLDGSMGALAAFGDVPNFVVSVGGFHPAYDPPALPFPPLSRIGINVLHTPLARIRVDAYFAVTSNTVQFGARAEVFFGLKIAKVEGHLAFDALFQFSPFYFVIQISASLSVKLFGRGLFSVRFRGSLEGTSPWHIEGTGSISILWWDIGVDFSHTWGEQVDTRLPSIPVLPVLAGELAKVENWTAEPADANRLLVSLAPAPAGAGAELVLHPVGSLRITQRAIPLGVTIDKVGSQRPSDANRFTVAAKTSGMEKRAAVRESFAMAQFQDMDDGRKLSAADYEKEDAGLELAVAGDQTRTSFVSQRIARYEEIILDSNFKRAVRRFTTLIAGLFTHFLANNAVARAEVSARSRDLKHLFDPKVSVQPNAYAVVSAADNSPIDGVPLAFASQASAREYVAAETARNPAFARQAHIVRPHEVRRAA